MRSPLSLIAILLLITVLGCGTSQPPATVYVTVPQSVAKPTDVARPKPDQLAKPAESVKPSDPWEDARAYFKKAKETEKTATEDKLKKLDNAAAAKIGFYVERCRKDVSTLAAGEYPSSIGQELWSSGFNELVEANSSWVLDDERFRSAFKTLNPKPTAKEVVNAAVRFATTHNGLREGTLRVIEKNGDTKNDAEVHRAATGWTGK